jgi:hypothetical protein
MQGVVTDAATGKPLYPVTVVNEFTQEGTSTDEKGVYSISARPGDVIVFTYIGYKVVQKTRPNTVLIATMDIKLEPTEYQMQEFQFHAGHLTQYQLDSVERATIYKIPLGRTHPSPIMNPASALAEKFSKRAKIVYRFQKTFAAGEIEKFVDSRYSPRLVTQLTGITGDSIGHFMYAYPMPYDFARAASDLEIKMWIRSNYKEWIKNISKDSVVVRH